MTRKPPKVHLDSMSIQSGYARHLSRGSAASTWLAKSQSSILFNAFDQLLTLLNISWQIMNFDANFVDEFNSDCFFSWVHTTDCRACTD